MHEVLNIRTQHDQILKLCPAESAKLFDGSAGGRDVFESFKKVSTFAVNDFSAQSWRQAIDEYEGKMAPLESTVAERLRKEFPQRNPAQAIRVFTKFSAVLERRNIKQFLSGEGEQLLSEVANFLEQVRSDFETVDYQEDLPHGRGLSAP